MPNRVLRDWTDSYRIEKLSAAAERFFARLIMKADDFGRYHADPRLLRAACFPLLPNITDTQIISWLDECCHAGLIYLYKVGGRKYLVIPNFRQRTRQSVSKYPPPQGFAEDWQPDSIEQCRSHDGHASVNRARGTETETETETNAGARGHAAGGGLPSHASHDEPLTPPTFDPVQKGLYRREYDGMLKDCDAEVKRVKENPAAFLLALSKSATELVEFLTKEKRDGWEARVDEVRKKRENYVKTKLTPEAQAVVAAWERRKGDIRKAMNGVK